MLWSALLLGVFGSFHCVGMCGPIAFMLPVDRQSETKKAFQVLLYHLGRLGAYGLIGLFFGLVGKSLYIFGLQQQLSIIIGIVMILVIVMPSVFKLNQLSQPVYRVISKLKSAMGNSFKKKSADTFLTIGFLNGFLPCGLVYMAVFASLAMQSPLEGTLYMVLFGLGTIPLMSAVVFFGGFLTAKSKRTIQRLIPIFIVFIGVLFIIRGLGLGIPYLSPTPMVDMASSNLECQL